MEVGDIIANFAGFAVLSYVAVQGLMEFMYYNWLFKSLNIKEDSEDGLIVGLGHTKTMKHFKKVGLSSMIVGSVSASIFLYQAVNKLILLCNN